MILNKINKYYWLNNKMKEIIIQKPIELQKQRKIPMKMILKQRNKIYKKLFKKKIQKEQIQLII